MGKIKILFFSLFVFTAACKQAPPKKPGKQEIIKKGSELFAKYGCVVCHSLDGKVIYGPPLNGIFMKNIKVLRQGQEFTVVADREYLKKAISEPRFEKVLEYSNKEMPIPAFTEEDANVLVEYLIALDEKEKSDK
jgi:cytochrome c oxidase subunit 2